GKRLGGRLAPQHKFAIDIKDPARMDVVEQNMPAALAARDANAIAHVGAADVVGVAAVDMKDVERELGAPVDEPGKNVAGIAGEQVHPARELALEEIDAFGGIGVRHDVDAVIFE